MKKIIYSLLLAAFACSCSSGGYTLTGEAQGVAAGDSIMLYSYYEQDVCYAAGVVDADNTFTLKGKLDEPAVAALVLNGRNMIGAFFLEQGKIKVVATQESVVFSGSKSNDDYNKYNDASAQLEQKFNELSSTLSPEEFAAVQEQIYAEYRELVSSTVDENLDNIFGAFVFANDEFNLLEGTQAKDRLEGFAPELLEQPFMEEVTAMIDEMIRTDIGQPYTDITLTDIKGNEVSVSILLAQGKYVLIDFWATWCNPCVAELPHLKEAYAELKGKNFEIFAISLDRSAESWQAMVDSSMPWVNVMDKADVAASEAYAIRSIPSNFLISPDGVIVAKNLRGELLAATVEGFMKQ